MRGEVWLSLPARHQLGRQEYDAGIECGGALYGGVDCDSGELWIADLTDNGSEGRNGTTTEMRMNTEFIDRMSARHREMTGWELAGLWHAHPDESANRVQPSPQDLTTWTSWWRHGGEQPFVGLIISRSISRYDQLPGEPFPFECDYDGGDG